MEKKISKGLKKTVNFLCSSGFRTHDFQMLVTQITKDTQCIALL